MAIIGYPLIKQRPPRAEKVYIADTFRGQLRVRSWPRSRGTNQEQHMQDSWEWLKAMVVAYKLSDGRTIEVSRENGNLTRSRPQDWWLHITSGRAWLIETDAGTKIYPQRFVANLSHALDTACFADAAMAVRAPDGWRPLPGGSPGTFLVMGPTMPQWLDGTGVIMNQPTTEPAGNVSDSLDAISQTTGALLMRGPEFWVELAPGQEGDILRINANGFPEWMPVP